MMINMDQFEQASRLTSLDAKQANLSDMVQHMASFALFADMLKHEEEGGGDEI
jgi:hypothetical protein